MQRRYLNISVSLCLLFAGCSGDRPRTEIFHAEPLAVQQSRAYPETVTGMFVSLVDFEESFDGQGGFRQIDSFHVDPLGSEGKFRFVTNITRTGAGAMEVRLSPRSELVFTNPGFSDFSGYTLFAFALYSESLRDDLQVTLISNEASWTSHRTLITPGWNNVLVDIQRLDDMPDFNVKRISQIRIRFADSVGDVTFNIDDMMLIDNTRTLQGLPPGFLATKMGLDYCITLPGRPEGEWLRQGSDGLWRWDTHQPVVKLSDTSAPFDNSTQSMLGLMGGRKVGRVEILESNPVRLVLSNTWYFPTRAGEWASLAIRQISWTDVFYCDRRHVAQMQLNNSGGKKITQAGLFLDSAAAWSDGTVSAQRVDSHFAGPVTQWNYLNVTGDEKSCDAVRQSYMNPGEIEIHIGVRGQFSSGDYNQDYFDESEGCYQLTAAANGHCRFTLKPTACGIVNPVFKVQGKWAGNVTANAAGLPIRDIVKLQDGAVLFMLNQTITTPTRIEVAGNAE